MKPNAESALNPREVRRQLGLNQQEFWSRIGVTQSGGSRYESGRRMPKPVRELLRLVHVERIDLARINRADFELLEYLKTNAPETYQGAREQVIASLAAPLAAAARPAAMPVEIDADEDFEGDDYAFTSRSSTSEWSDDTAPTYEELNALTGRN